jgi:hypothetical protein
MFQCDVGLELDGQKSTVTGSIFRANTNGDIVLDDTNPSYNVISGNGCHSNLANSIFSAVGDFNVAVANVMNGAATLAGGSSLAANNVSY